MKNVLCCFFFLSAAVFAQVPSDNVAADALRKRCVLSMNLLNPPARTPPGPAPIMLAGQVTQPKVCSVPLLNAIQPGTADAMGIVKPKVDTRGDTVLDPTPPCGRTTFTNK